MINLDKILVALDLSEYSVKAFKYGCDLAEEMQADCHYLAFVIIRQPVK
jgi:hypothetical protein